jgi:hypothetical protein
LLKVALNTIKQTNKHLIIPNCIWMFSIGSLIVTWPLTIIEWPTYFHWTGWQPFYFYRQFCFNRGVVTIDNLSIFTLQLGIIKCLFVCLMVFNATFNNISNISWWSVLLMEETEGQPPTCCKSLTNFNVVHLVLGGIQTNNISGDRHRLHR